MVRVYGFDHEHDRAPRELRSLLGGKGANLAEMMSVLELPVPPGFTITTEVCRAYLDDGWPDELGAELADHVQQLEQHMGKRLGDPADPLLVSVRSGAEISMPGMMDTVLNLGLNDESVRGLAKQTGDERFAYDSYRRFVQIFGNVVMGVDASGFHDRVSKAQELGQVEREADIPVPLLKYLVSEFKSEIESASGRSFPETPHTQLRLAIESVFSWWNGARALAYWRREGIANDLCTACSIQAMVFGNRDDTSGTGVGFTRDPSTGENKRFGDFLLNAQGEDVVAGTHTPEPLDSMANSLPEVHRELLAYLDRLEVHYRDMCDVEFTIEQGKLWVLQTRVGERSGTAALRMAVEMIDDPQIALTREEAVLRISADHLEQILHPHFAEVEHTVLATGLAASPGAAVGRVYFSAEAAVAASERGEQVILVRQETSPEDVHGMAVSEGILTSRGGLVSHAAVVARGWGKPAVCGAETVHVHADYFLVDETVVREGDTMSIDGSTGEVILGELHLAATEPPAHFFSVLSWADEIRAGKMAVRTNADTGPDAAKARQFGAEGIGLCRTEHMFLGDDRLPVMREMILARTPAAEATALDKLRRVQKADFVEILDAMDGLPVTVRLLDPPLHEFLPTTEELAVKEALGTLADGEAELLEAARAWSEVNPMIGTRGVRLGYLKPGLYAMQVRALLEAAAERLEAGGDPQIEVMIPLTVTAEELRGARQWVQEAIDQYAPENLDIKIGTMIETPRAAICAGELAAHADFFSFGTNDLSQLTFGFSRDDIEGRIMSVYLEQGLLAANPFESIDRNGVGRLVKAGAALGPRSKA